MTKAEQLVKEINYELEKRDRKASVDIINTIQEKVDKFYTCSCGKRISPSDNFCYNCGNKLKEDVKVTKRTEDFYNK